MVLFLKRVELGEHVIAGIVVTFAVGGDSEVVSGDSRAVNGFSEDGDGFSWSLVELNGNAGHLADSPVSLVARSGHVSDSGRLELHVGGVPSLGLGRCDRLEGVVTVTIGVVLVLVPSVLLGVVAAIVGGGRSLMLVGTTVMSSVVSIWGSISSMAVSGSTITDVAGGDSVDDLVVVFLSLSLSNKESCSDD